MTQIHLTLKTEFLKDLFIDDKGEASRKLVEKVIDTLLNAEVERLNGEIKRRESVIRIFPNVSSILKLMGAILMDENEKWSQRKYMELKGLTEDISLKTAAPWV